MASTLHCVSGGAEGSARTPPRRLPILADGPRSSAELAELTGVSARSLHRLLRALASVGVFADVEDGRFGLTPLADCLWTDVPGSLRANGILTAELLHPAWSELLHSLSGTPIRQR